MGKLTPCSRQKSPRSAAILWRCNVEERYATGRRLWKLRLVVPQRRIQKSWPSLWYTSMLIPNVSQNRFFPFPKRWKVGKFEPCFPMCSNPVPVAKWSFGTFEMSQSSNKVYTNLYVLKFVSSLFEESVGRWNKKNEICVFFNWSGLLVYGRKTDRKIK